MVAQPDDGPFGNVRRRKYLAVGRCLGSLRTLYMTLCRRLDVEENIRFRVFSVLKPPLWIVSQVSFSALCCGGVGWRVSGPTPTECLGECYSTFVAEGNQSWNIWHEVGQVSLRWVTLSSTSMKFVRIRKVSSDCHVRRGIWFISVEMIIWFLGSFRVINRWWVKYSLMESLDIKQVSYLSAWVSDPVLDAVVSLLIIRSAGRRSGWRRRMFVLQSNFPCGDGCLSRWIKKFSLCPDGEMRPEMAPDWGVM